MADAYYVLSDPARRREYDNLYASRSFTDRTDDPNSSSNFFTQFTGMFTGAGTGSGRTPGAEPRPDAEGVFADVFEEV